MDNYFANLSDEDFYSNKLTHIYFTSKVNDETIDKLISEIKEENKKKDAKPILIHICSFGGKLTDGIRFLTVFNISKVPIATIIDNYSCSAATFLSISSPYRIMNRYGYCLLHEYSISGKINAKRNNFLQSIQEIDKYFGTIIDMYIKKTKFTIEELTELLQHNLFLDYKICLSKGIVDSIINIEYNTNVNTKLDINNSKIDFVADNISSGQNLSGTNYTVTSSYKPSTIKYTREK